MMRASFVDMKVKGSSSEGLSREYPLRPIAAVGVVVRKGDHVLLVRRGRPPGGGLWTLPGGVIELGETAHTAAARELHEECGIEAQVRDVLGVVDVIERDARRRVRFHYVIIEFAADYTGGTLSPASDILQARWVLPEELGNYDLSPAARRVIRRASRG